MAAARDAYDNGVTSARNEAEIYLDENDADYEVDNVIFNHDKTVTVDANSTVNYAFAKVLGLTSGNVGASATAIYGPVTSVKGLNGIAGVVPFGVNENQELEFSKKTEFKVYKHDGSGEYGPGWFGALDLDGEEGGGANDYCDWLKEGYPDYLHVGDRMITENGNMKGPTDEALFDLPKKGDDPESRVAKCLAEHDPPCTIDNYEPTCPRVIIVPIYEAFYDEKDKDKDKEKRPEYMIIKGFALFLLDIDKTTRKDDDGKDIACVTGQFIDYTVPLEGIDFEVDPDGPDYGLRAARLIK